VTLGAGGNILVGDFLMTKNTMNGDIEAAEPAAVVSEGQAIIDYEAAVAMYDEKVAKYDQKIDEGKDASKELKEVDKAETSMDNAGLLVPPSYFGVEPEPEPEADPDAPPPPVTNEYTEAAPGPETPRVVDPRAISGDAAGLENFTASELTLFNRMEWTKTQATLPDATGTPVDNPLYVEGYTPRYYTLYGDNPVYAFNDKYVDSKGKESGTWFNAQSESWLGKEHISGFGSGGVSEFLPGHSALDGAAISPLMPNGRWLDDSQLIDFWTETSNSLADGTPFELNAVLYSNNATMLLSRKASTYGGQAIINGGLVGADMGILVPGSEDGGVGLQLNYDFRQARAIQLRNLERVVLIRGPRLR
jgi:hypothetical protein